MSAVLRKAWSMTDRGKSRTNSTLGCGRKTETERQRESERSIQREWREREREGANNE